MAVGDGGMAHVPERNITRQSIFKRLKQNSSVENLKGKRNQTQNSANRKRRRRLEGPERLSGGKDFHSILKYSNCAFVAAYRLL